MEYSASDAITDALFASDCLYDSSSAWSNGVDHMTILKHPLQRKLSGYIHHLRYLDAVENILDTEVQKVNRQQMKTQDVMTKSKSNRDESNRTDVSLESMLLQKSKDKGADDKLNLNEHACFPQTVNLSQLSKDPTQSRLLSGITCMSEGVNDKQLKKDVERDTLVVNGVKMVGANIGIEGLYAQMERDTTALLAECNLPSTTTLLQRFVHTCGLQHVTRSNSGVVAFQILQALSQDVTTILLPVSEKQYPLRIDCRIGGYESRDRGTYSYSDSDSDSGHTDGGGNGADGNNSSSSDGSGHGHHRLRWGLIVHVDTSYLFRVIVTPPTPPPPLPIAADVPLSVESLHAFSTATETGDDDDDDRDMGEENVGSNSGAGETVAKCTVQAVPNSHVIESTSDPVIYHVLLTYSTQICVEIDPRQKLIDLEPAAVDGSDIDPSHEDKYRNVHFCDEFVKMECIDYLPSSS